MEWNTYILKIRSDLNDVRYILQSTYLLGLGLNHGYIMHFF